MTVETQNFVSLLKPETQYKTKRTADIVEQKKEKYMMKQTIILGNIVTMDEKRPFAKAALVKDGVFAYIGSAEEVGLCRRADSGLR